MGYLDKPNKKDKEILAFCKSYDSERFRVREYELYYHCDEKIMVLVSEAELSHRKLVKALDKLVKQAIKEGR